MINCLIVDDEPFARKIIVEFCSHIPALRIIGECGNALEARNILQQQKADILFLDVHLPVLDGIGFLKTLVNSPQVIFTTAYKEYAAEAFDMYSCDYLVKPFSLERFIIAVDKALKRLDGAVTSTNENKSSTTEEYFFIKTDGKIYKLLYAEIKYTEAKGNYTKIVTTSTVIVPKISFSNIEMLLPVNLFIRVHRSFIVNKSKITLVEGNTILLDKSEIPVGNNYKETFLKSLGL